MSPPIFGIVGYKNNGKTTLVVRLVEHFVRAGLRVSTVKHAHHAVETDEPGKDTWRHREAGASEVLLATARRWVLTHELRDEAEPDLSRLVAHLGAADLVLVEGFKRHGHPKLEVHRRERGTPLIATGDASVVAIASDHPIDAAVPVFQLDDVARIAAFILTRTGLGPSP